MKSRSLFLLLICLFIYGCNSEIPVDQLSYSNGLRVIKESGEPFTGLSIRFEGGDTPAEIIEYKEGKLDGRIQRWYPNGELKEEFNGRLNNKFYMMAQAFDMGNRGQSRRGGKDTLDKATQQFLIRYGEEHKWHDSGEMQSEGEYSEDGSRKVGAWRKWYKNGELEQEGSYSSLPVVDEGRGGRRRQVEGVKVGQWRQWYESGELNTEALYNDEGQQNGIWKTYCKNGNTGKEVEFKSGILVGTKKYWACDGKELDHINYVNGKQHGSFVTYVTKKRTALDSLINTVDFGGKVEYDVNAEDYFKAKQGVFDNGEKSGLWTTWDKTGKVTSITDYSKDNFLDPEYSKSFLKKGKFGPYAIRYSRWKINNYNFKKAKPDIEATQLYLKQKLINPAKKIITRGNPRWGKYNRGVSHWSYPIIVAPEAIYDIIKTHPGVRADAVDSNGRNRLHLCTILMLGKKPGRCSIEHFKSLVKDVPVNNADIDGMTAMNYVAEANKSRYRKLDTEGIAVEAIKALVKAGAKINHQNVKGQSTLMRALSHKKYMIAKALLDLGADVNAKDIDGKNAIHYVFFQPTSNTYRYSFKLDDNRKEILTLLAQKGTKIDLADLKGESVKAAALKQGAVKTALFLETLSEFKTDAKKLQPVVAITPLTVSPDVQNVTIKEEKRESAKISPSPIEINISKKITAATEKETAVSSKPEIIQVDQEGQLYQTALAQIKRSRLSKPKGDSALDSLNELTALTSKSDSRVIELRQKIADKYLALARRRINDYRYQDAVKFIKASQGIKASNTATQLLHKAKQSIAEERQYQQQQNSYSNSQSQPVQREESDSSFGDIFKSIFD